LRPGRTGVGDRVLGPVEVVALAGNLCPVLRNERR
jgi:hypothetical protein